MIPIDGEQLSVLFSEYTKKGYASIPLATRVPP
jgi:hypothetical protein